VFLSLSVTLPTGWVVVGAIALVLLTAYLLAGIIGPMPSYRILSGNEIPSNDSPQFLALLESLVDAGPTGPGSWKFSPMVHAFIPPSSKPFEPLSAA
jgi:hypothetical protein